MQYSIRSGLITSIALSVMQWIIFGLFVWQLPPEIPLYFSLPTGQNQLANKDMYILIPLVCLSITILNSILMRFKKDTPPVYASIIVWSSVLICLLGTISMLHIVLLML